VRQSCAFLGLVKRVSTSEHGIAGHDRLALSVRSWSSCSIAAMRRLKSENLEFFGHGAHRHAVTIIVPRVLFAPLAVLSPGPRLAGTPSTGKEVWNWALGSSSNGTDQSSVMGRKRAQKGAF
jgi:hypothetical protein